MAIVDALGVSYVHDDHLGTPQVMTDGAAAVVWDASYRPFGEATIAGAAANEQRFPGQTADAETGWYDNWHRTYDPSLGRYLQSHPIGIMAGFNTYGYAAGNPVMYADPTGQILPVLLWWLIGTEFAVGYAEGFVIAYSAYQAVMRIYARYEAGCRGWDLVSVWDVLDIIPVLRFVKAVKVVAGVGKAGGPAFAAANGGGTPPVPTKGSGPGLPGGGPKGPGGGGGPIGADGNPQTMPPFVYRGATKGNPNHVTPRAHKGETGVSFRDSQSNPLPSDGPAVLKPGKNYIEVDTSQLPPGSVVLDGGTVVDGVRMPPGHVTVIAPPEAVVNATTAFGKYPK